MLSFIDVKNNSTCQFVRTSFWLCWNDYNHLLNSLHCSIKSDAVKKAVMNMTVDSWIIVKGKITDVGEVLGYTIDIDEFG